MARPAMMILETGTGNKTLKSDWHRAHYFTSLTDMGRLNPSPDKNGFTLIEILVALVIISIVLSVALVKFDLNNPEKKLRQEAGRLTRIMELAEQQAIFQSVELGILFNSDGYEVYQYTRNKWKPSSDSLLGKHTLPDNIELVLDIEGSQSYPKTSPAINNVPQIVFYSSGESTPFEVTVKQASGNRLFFIISNLKTGKLEILRESNL